ncbi:TerD family protein [Metabacillus sp. RGM 3146]|uniref:TerD family protein n=1 Tax=Metabacillus sp. RGM 3146 TaxID=3401092 RepID=UPI003B9D8DE5
MGVTLRKGQKVDLTKTHPGLSNISVGLGWDVNRMGGTNYDLDASVFLLGENGKVPSDNDFVFYNNPSGAGGSVLYVGDNRTGTGSLDDELIKVDLSRVPQSFQKIAFTITIHDAQVKGQNFGQVSNAYVRVFKEDSGEELLRYDLGQEFFVETAIVAAELYRHNGEWKFNAVGSGFQGGLAALCRNFGVNVEDDPATVHPQQGTGFNHTFQPNQPSYGNQPPGTGYQQQHNQGYPQQGGMNTYQQQPNPFQPSYAQPNSMTYQTPQNAPYGGSSNPMNQNQYTGGRQGQVSCPRCHSTNLNAGKKGFGIGKAAVGGLLLGPVGLLGGFVGGNKVQFKCGQCFHKFSPEQKDVAAWANEQKRNAQDLFLRFKNQDVLDAVVSGCALVSMADGNISQSERQKVHEFIHSSQELRVFDTQKVIDRFNYFVSSIERDWMIGRAEALKALGRIRTKPEIGRLVVRYSIAIGFADGNFDPSEQQTVSDICRELGLNPSEFLS